MQTSAASDVRLRVVRPREGRRIAGVAAGFGNAFGIDPNLIRIHDLDHDDLAALTPEWEAEASKLAALDAANA